MFYLIFVFLFVLLEWYLKSKIEKTDYQTNWLNGSIIIKGCRNYGLIFGWFRRTKYLPVIFQCAVFLLLCIVCGPELFLKTASVGSKIGCMLLLAGAAGNVLDRLSRGYVVDYIRFPRVRFKKLARLVFNLADFLIFIGAFLFLIMRI